MEETHGGNTIKIKHKIHNQLPISQAPGTR